MMETRRGSDKRVVLRGRETELLRVEMESRKRERAKVTERDRKGRN